MKLVLSVLVSLSIIQLGVLYLIPDPEIKIENSGNIAVIVFDGLSAKFISSYPELKPRLISGEFAEKAIVKNFEKIVNKFSKTVLKVNYPETTPSHAAMYLTGDCNRPENPKYCLEEEGIVSICDLARKANYLCIMVSQAGDFYEGRKEFDIVLHDKGVEEFKVEINGKTDAKLIEFFEKQKKKLEFLKEEKSKKQKDKLEQENKLKEKNNLEDNSRDYAEYNKLIFDVDKELIEFMEKELPEQKFVLFSNVVGIDKCGHSGGVKKYLNCIEETDEKFSDLAETLIDSDLVYAITADHGMNFKCLDCRGGHAGEDYAKTEEALTVPLIVSTERDLLEGSNFDLMPTLFELAGVKNSCKAMKYCKGKSLIRRAA